MDIEPKKVNDRPQRNMPAANKSIAASGAGR
jgi:hypothetical protein